MRRLGLLFLIGCSAPEYTNDVSGDWYGSYSHVGADLWALRLFDLAYIGPLDGSSLTLTEGVWQQWKGTFEMWGTLDIAAVRPWYEDGEGVATQDLVSEVELWVCEDEIRCTGESWRGDQLVSPPNGYSLYAGFESTSMSGLGTYTPDGLTPLSGAAVWSDSDSGDFLNGTILLSPAYAGLQQGDPP